MIVGIQSIGPGSTGFGRDRAAAVTTVAPTSTRSRRWTAMVSSANPNGSTTWTAR